MRERPRRLRRTPWLREMVAEVHLCLSQLIQPYFLESDPGAVTEISGFIGVKRWGVDALSDRIEADVEKGLRHFLLFGSAHEGAKDSEGRSGLAPDGLMPGALRVLRRRFGSAITLMSDVCLCPYTDHGHCGLVRDGVENDLSLGPLTQMALVHAQAGADMVAPSDMMDGRVGAIRQVLDDNGYSSTAILAYTAKYASGYYGPFREALGSAPKSLSRESYQMDFRNRAEALREARLDKEEGADILMVKPALAYLDIILAVKNATDLPVAAYSVSGEYQMVKLMAHAGVACERSLAVENLTAIRRAGAQSIVTYWASECAQEGWIGRE